MRAYVLRAPGGPEALELCQIPRPSPGAGQVLIQIKAFGLNRAEHFTRRGFSPSVQLPRVIGIECVGTVVAAPQTGFVPGQTVAAMMGGMGRAYNGSYAEYTCVPAAHVFPVHTSLDWAALGALPEMLQTTAGSLGVGLECDRAQTLLVRGGTSSIGLAAIAMARRLGLTVAATSRTAARFDVLTRAGAHHALVDCGALAARVGALFPGGADRVLELIGTTTLADSLRCCRPGGIVCMTGILGGQWVWDGFQPMGDIPTGVKLTSYSGGSGDISAETLQALVDDVADGRLEIRRGRVFSFDDVVEAHRVMDANAGGGKMVVVV